jgi:hypothetical protein
MNWVWVMIPLTALMIPIVAVMAHHQQKMAQILNQNKGDHGDVVALRQEIAELKTLVQSQTIALDNLASFQKGLNAPPAYPVLTDQAR